MADGSETKREDLEQRLHQVEAALGLKAPAIEDRLETVETKLEALKPDHPASPWLTALDYVIRIASALTPVVVLVVGFMITGSVELAIKEARLKLDEAKALDSLVKNFRKSDIGLDEARRTALLILEYGNAGIRPLVQDLDVDQSTQVRAEAAAQALRIHAILSDNRERFCALLGRIDGMQPPVFGPQGLSRVSKLRGQIGCGGGG